jgi:pyruvate formate lyase activating enzyme
MKIAAFQPLSLSDFPPYCAAIVFTIGCNLRCSYCHNKNLWDENHPQIDQQEVFDFLLAKINKLDGVVITGGEPTIQHDLLPFIKAIKALGYKIKLNTNGTNPTCLQKLIEQNLVDYIAMDIKGPLNYYTRICGTNTFLDNIKKSLDLIASSKTPHEFRTVWDKKLLTELDIEATISLLPKNSKHITSLLS